MIMIIIIIIVVVVVVVVDLPGKRTLLTIPGSTNRKNGKNLRYDATTHAPFPCDTFFAVSVRCTIA